MRRIIPDTEIIGRLANERPGTTPGAELCRMKTCFFQRRRALGRSNN